MLVLRVCYSELLITVQGILPPQLLSLSKLTLARECLQIADICFSVPFSLLPPTSPLWEPVAFLHLG